LQFVIHLIEMVLVLEGDIAYVVIRMHTTLAHVFSPREGSSEREGSDGIGGSELAHGPIPIVIIKGAECLARST